MKAITFRLPEEVVSALRAVAGRGLKGKSVSQGSIVERALRRELEVPLVCPFCGGKVFLRHNTPTCRHWDSGFEIFRKEL